MDQPTLYFGIAALIVILVIGLRSSTFGAILNRRGLKISGEKKEKDSVSVTDIKKKSDIEVSSKDSNVEVKNIEDSNVKIDSGK